MREITRTKIAPGPTDIGRYTGYDSRLYIDLCELAPCQFSRHRYGNHSILSPRQTQYPVAILDCHRHDLRQPIQSISQIVRQPRHYDNTKVLNIGSQHHSGTSDNARPLGCYQTHGYPVLIGQKGELSAVSNLDFIEPRGQQCEQSDLPGADQKRPPVKCFA